MMQKSGWARPPRILNFRLHSTAFPMKLQEALGRGWWHKDTSEQKFKLTGPVRELGSVFDLRA